MVTKIMYLIVCIHEVDIRFMFAHLYLTYFNLVVKIVTYDEF